MQVVQSDGLPIKLWLDYIEDGAMEQVKHLAKLPFAFKHVAIMPDAHQGYGMPIGGVLATKRVVVPNAVGVDIGCGVCAVKTDITLPDTDSLKRTMGLIRDTIPVGFSHRDVPCPENYMPSLTLSNGIVEREYEKARKQLGTLGGGNHFIEIQKGDDGFIYVMIHSGSRNIGKQVADYYNKIAVELNNRWHSSIPKEWQLAFLPLDTDEGQAYMEEMEYCLQFAQANREMMMRKAIEAFDIDADDVWDKLEITNIHHNYAVFENHFGQNVMVHRKGATSAREGQIGIIPGSQGTHSYIVKGKGNIESFMSCSHGAGRKMGRNQAKRELSLKDEMAKMGDIVHGIRHKKDLDEAPGAYKNIEKVIAQELDLIEPLVVLRPLAVIKG